MKKNILASLTTVAMITMLPQTVFALSVGEALAIGAGFYVLNKATQDNSRYQYVPPEQEYRRGLEDGFNRARYDNPRNSQQYDEGYTEGRRRASAGWISPFSKT